MDRETCLILFGLFQMMWICWMCCRKLSFMSKRSFKSFLSDERVSSEDRTTVGNTEEMCNLVTFQNDTPPPSYAMISKYPVVSGCAQNNHERQLSKEDDSQNMELNQPPPPTYSQISSL